MPPLQLTIQLSEILPALASPPNQQVRYLDSIARRLPRWPPPTRRRVQLGCTARRAALRGLFLLPSVWRFRPERLFARTQKRIPRARIFLVPRDRSLLCRDSRHARQWREHVSVPDELWLPLSPHHPRGHRKRYSRR